MVSALSVMGAVAVVALIAAILADEIRHSGRQAPSRQPVPVRVEDNEIARR